MEQKINYRHRLTLRELCPHHRKPGKGLINADKMKRAMPVKIALLAQQKKKSVS